MRIGSTTIGFFCVCVIANSQGTVDLANHIVSQALTIDAPFFDDRGVRLAGLQYVAQLYAWKPGTGFVPEGNPVPFATDGYFQQVQIMLDFVPCGLPVWVQVRAWRVVGGASFEEAASSRDWTGVSNVLFLSQTGCPGAPPSEPARLIGLEYPGSPILVRPPHSQAIRAGESATLSVLASSGVQMSYQWYRQPSEWPDGLILGATNATYSTPALNNNTTFWVSVSNSAGSVLSDKATVTVVPAVPRLTIVQMVGLPLLRLDGSVGFTYRIEYSTNLNANNWTSLVELSLNATPFTFSDSGWSNSPARYYRGVVQ